MSTRTAFEKARAQGRAALVGYLPAGFPDVAGGIDAMLTMVDAGCDVIEVGLPYSDPVMDGPTVQAAAQRALEGGVRTRDVLRTVEAVAATGTPTVVMTYWNPVERYGVQRFAAVEENACRRRPARQPLARFRQRVRGVILDREALLRELDRRRDQLGECQLAGAVFLVRQREAGHGAGYADGKP